MNFCELGAAAGAGAMQHTPSVQYVTVTKYSPPPVYEQVKTFAPIITLFAGVISLYLLRRRKK